MSKILGFKFGPENKLIIGERGLLTSFILNIHYNFTVRIRNLQRFCDNQILANTSTFTKRDNSFYFKILLQKIVLFRDFDQ